MALRSYTCSDCGRRHVAFSNEQIQRCFICQCVVELTQHQRSSRVQAAGAAVGMTGSTMHLAVGLHRRDFAAQFRSDAARHPSRLLRGSPSACGAGPCAPATVASMDKLSVVLVAVFAGLPLAWRDG